MTNASECRADVKSCTSETGIHGRIGSYSLFPTSFALTRIIDRFGTLLTETAAMGIQHRRSLASRL